MLIFLKLFIRVTHARKRLIASQMPRITCITIFNAENIEICIMKNNYMDVKFEWAKYLHFFLTNSNVKTNTVIVDKQKIVLVRAN